MAAYTDKDKNRLIESEEFSLSNSICGFGVRSGFGGGGNRVSYCRYDEYWCESRIIDTPFKGISRDETKRTKKEIIENKTVIDSIIERLASI